MTDKFLFFMINIFSMLLNRKTTTKKLYVQIIPDGMTTKQFRYCDIITFRLLCPNSSSKNINIYINIISKYYSRKKGVHWKQELKGNQEKNIQFSTTFHAFN